MSSPPSVLQLHLPQSGSLKAVAGDGWFLDISQGGRGAVSVGTNDGAGHPHNSGSVDSEVEGAYGKLAPIPLKGLLGVYVGDFSSGGRHHLVVSGGVPRGTTGVGVIDATGHRGWATLVDPGADFDTLFFSYEPPSDAASGCQTVRPSLSVALTFREPTSLPLRAH